MYQLSEQSAIVLRAVLKLGEATYQEVSSVVGFDTQQAINSLKRCGYVIVAKTVKRVINCRRGTCTKPVNSYSVTDKGRLSLHNRDFPPARQMKALKVPLHPVQLHKMESFIIPDRDPNVEEMMAEIGGRMAKITYGVHHEYEVYRPAPDRSRNYTPRLIRGIHAL